MEEIKPRLLFVDSVLTGTCGPMPKRVAQETCYLQLRLICELIALACVVAHGDVVGTRTASTRKRYEADKLIGMLQQLHPYFYPKPVTHTKDGPSHHNHQFITSGYLTRKDLVLLHAECGKILHRGTVEDILSRHERSVDLKRVKEWADKIAALLKDHFIQLIDGENVYLVKMYASDGKVQMATGHWTVKPKGGFFDEPQA